MKYDLSKRAEKTLNKIDRISRERIEKGLEKIPIGDIIKLEGSDVLHRLRIGDWRIVFFYEDVKIDENIETIAMVVKINARGGIYKGV